MSHILITGLPGVGKTTLIRKLAQRLTDYQPIGFYTEEIRVRGIRKGFQLVTLDGRQQILSHVDHHSPHRVGRYRVDVVGFERLLAELNLSHPPSRVIVIDEIGKMECLSRWFVEQMRTLLDSSRTVIATIALKGIGFIQQVKQRPDCRIVTVTVENRDSLAETLTREIGAAMRETQ